MGHFTISRAIFNSKPLVKLPEGSLRWEFCVPNMTRSTGWRDGIQTGQTGQPGQPGQPFGALEWQQLVSKEVEHHLELYLGG